MASARPPPLASIASMGQSIDDFVRARIAEDVARARTAMAARRQPAGKSTDRSWVGALTDAMDKSALLESAVTAEWDGRGEYAAAIRRRLAETYAQHPDFRAEWRA
jgi:hypothetical protein